MSDPVAPFILFRDDFSGEETLFDRPSAIISAESTEDFLPALEQAQRAHEAGKWLAGYFSYEAGYLLEPKLTPILPEGRRIPLMAMGVFDGPSDEPLSQDRPPLTNGPIFGVRETWSYEDYKARFDRVHRHLREG